MKPILLFLICICSPFIGYACSCAGVAENFCGTVERDTSISLVVKVKKEKDYYHGMVVKITEVIQGTPRSERITVWGDNGALCRLYTSVFQDGEEMILALHDSDLIGNWVTTGQYPEDIEKEEDYVLSACGVYFLRVDGNQVIGTINGTNWEEQTMRLKEFEASGCLKYVSKLRLHAYPNPTTDVLNIDIWEINIPEITVNIYTTNGQLIRQQVFENGNRQLPINMKGLDVGMYLIVVQAAGFEPKTEKIMLK